VKNRTHHAFGVYQLPLSILENYRAGDKPPVQALPAWQNFVCRGVDTLPPLLKGGWGGFNHARKELNSGKIVQFGMILSTSIINKQ
jgi:hypothetical protein